MATTIFTFLFLCIAGRAASSVTVVKDDIVEEDDIVDAINGVSS
jgi:hypothetical protein